MTIEYAYREGIAFISITNHAGLTLTLSELGASIRSIVYQGSPMTVQPKSTTTFLHGHHHGKTIGPIFDRIQDGRYSIHGQEYVFPVNASGVAAKSGKMNTGTKVFKSEVCDKEEAVSVLFSYTVPATEYYPANISVLVRYLISKEKPEFTCQIKTKSDVDAPINFTNHCYFNLGGEETVLGDTLLVHADQIGTYTEKAVPTGIAPIPSCCDFRVAKPIGKDIEDSSLLEEPYLGYDHAFVLEEVEEGEPNAVLENEKYRLEFFTNAPAVHIYTNNHPHEDLEVGEGIYDRKYSSITFEPISIPGSIESYLVKGEETIRRIFTCRFQEKQA